jgi:hypothetical protein
MEAGHRKGTAHEERLLFDRSPKRSVTPRREKAHLFTKHAEQSYE